MAHPTSKNRTARALDSLQRKAVVGCAAGVAMGLLPLWVGPTSPLASLAAVLGPLGWLVLALGVGLLVWHRFAKPTVSLPAREGEAVGKASLTMFQPVRRQRKPKPNGTARTGRDASAGTGAATGSAAASAPAPSGEGATPALPTAWSDEVFAAMEWQRFEAVCEGLFAQAGLETQLQSHGAEGGVNVWLYRRHLQGPAAVVHCKHRRSLPVGVKELREFFGVMVANELVRGTYATSGAYTPAARQFAKVNGIQALDRADLLHMIAERSPEEQQALLRVALDGEYWRPTCASCGVKMVERTPSHGGPRFWGCSDYPRCKLRLPMVPNLKQLSLLIE